MFERFSWNDTERVEHGWDNTMDNKMGGCDDTTQGKGRRDTIINNMTEDGTDISPEFTATFATIVTNLGMPDPRPDIRCGQYLP